MFNSLFNLVHDTVKLVTIPVELAIDVIDAPVKAVGEVMQDLAKDIKDAIS